VVTAVVLDSSPLGLLAAPSRISLAAACDAWATSLLAAGHRVFLPEIADYEIRRELLRLRAVRRIARLDGFRSRFEYVPITTAAMDRAAELWAYARHTGQPTAPDEGLDIDMILVAQAELLALPNTVIATANMNHIPRFHAAELWTAITP
jgi:predicted nucleic acid-binding protein